MRRLIATGLVVGGLIAAMPAVSASAVAATCRVEDARTGEHTSGAGPNLQRAIDAADPGDHLIISGICRGTFQMQEELRLTGVATPRFPKATLDAGGSGRVLKMRDGGIIRSVRIRDGRARTGGGIYLLDGTLELRGATEVIGNRAGRGGGIHAPFGHLTLFDRTLVKGNVSADGGGILLDYAIVTIRDHSSVRGNRSTGWGGGISINIGTLVMTGHSIVTRNRAVEEGGGVANIYGGSTFRNRASVVYNVAGATGGGVFVASASNEVCSRWVRLSPNTPDDRPQGATPVGC